MNERDAILDCLFIGGSTQDVMMRMERVPRRMKECRHGIM